MSDLWLTARRGAAESMTVGRETGFDISGISPTVTCSIVLVGATPG